MRYKMHEEMYNIAAKCTICYISDITNFALYLRVVALKINNLNAIIKRLYLNKGNFTWLFP